MVLLFETLIGHSWYGSSSPTSAASQPQTQSCVAFQATDSSSLAGITEAFKADKFEQKINLGTIPLRLYSSFRHSISPLHVTSDVPQRR
jgi:hypothetical protein